jgi:hypothetical protein
MPCSLVGRYQLLEELAVSIFKSHSYNMKIEVAGSSKALVRLNQTTQRHVPEDASFSSHHCKKSNLTSGTESKTTADLFSF